MEDEDTVKPPMIEEPWERLADALNKVAAVFGTSERHWNAVFTPGQVLVITAYVGPNHLAVAQAAHHELFIAQRMLAWELEELFEKVTYDKSN